MTNSTRVKLVNQNHGKVDLSAVNDADGNMIILQPRGSKGDTRECLREVLDHNHVQIALNAKWVKVVDLDLTPAVSEVKGPEVKEPEVKEVKEPEVKEPEVKEPEVSPTDDDASIPVAVENQETVIEAPATAESVEVLEAPAPAQGKRKKHER